MRQFYLYLIFIQILLLTANHIAFAQTSCQSPASPEAIVGRADICKGETVNYGVAPVEGATSYTWTLPDGWTGSSTTNTISAKAGSSGIILVAAVNECGTGEASAFEVQVHVAPAQPGLMKGNTEMCEGSVQPYCIETVEGATAYAWTFPNDWTGSSQYNSIALTAGKLSGKVSVAATNFCGSSPERSIDVEVTQLPCNAGQITGNLTVCEGVSQTYSIGPVNGATSYSWILPVGWTGTSTTNSITVTPGTTGGSLSVKADNECGSGNPTSVSIAVAPVPAQPMEIEGSEELCEGATVNFTVPEVDGATSYTWTLPEGWTGSSNTNTIELAAISSGTISVKANGLCGSSPVVSKQVSVLNLITAPVIDTIIQPNCEVPTGIAHLSGLPETGTWMITVNELLIVVESKPTLTSLRYTTGTIITGTGTTTEITGLKPGKYSFTVYAESGCTSAESESILVAIAPAIPSTPVVGEITHPTCEDNMGSIELTGLPATGEWTIESTPEALSVSGSGTEKTIDNVPSGSYTFKVTSENGCTSDASAAAVINAQPKNPDAAIVTQQDNVLHSSAPLGNQWFSQTGAIEGATDQDFTPLVAGNYYVVISVNGCTSDVSNTINFIITKVNQNPEKSLMIYPNPVEDEFMVDYGNVVPLNYEILDLAGNVVLNGQIQGSSVIKTNVLANGVYMFRINVDGEVVTRKLVKK